MVVKLYVEVSLALVGAFQSAIDFYTVAWPLGVLMYRLVKVPQKQFYFFLWTISSVLDTSL